MGTNDGSALMRLDKSRQIACCAFKSSIAICDRRVRVASVSMSPKIHTQFTRPNVWSFFFGKKQRPRRFAAFARWTNPLVSNAGHNPGGPLLNEKNVQPSPVVHEPNDDVRGRFQRGHRRKPRSRSVRISFNDDGNATANVLCGFAQRPHVAVNLTLPHRLWATVRWRTDQNASALPIQLGFVVHVY